MKLRRSPYLGSQLTAAVITWCLAAGPLAMAGIVWDGEGADTNINTAANWDNNVANALNGTTAATFGTGGSTATINTSASFTGITINRNGNFQIANGNGSLTIGAGGITVTLPNTTGRTHTISESSVVLGADQTWSITNNTGAAQLDVTGVVSGTSRVITKTGTGTLRLTGANTFSGGLSVNEGTVLAQTSGSSLGGGTVNLGATTAGTNNVALSLGTSATFANNIVVRSGNSGTVTINNFAAYNPTIAGTITLNKGLTINNNDNSAPNDTNMTFSGKISGGAANSLTLTGSNIANQITLSNAANDYTGATAVNSGTMRLTGGLGNTAVTVASGAAIGGEGTIGATGSLTFVSGGFLRADGSSSAALSVGGNLSFGATTHVILDGVPTTTGAGINFRLLNYSGSLTGGGTSFVLQNAANYRGHSFSTATPNQVNMSLDTKALTWSGASSAAWDINSSSNWDSLGAEKFYQGDAITFTDSGSNKAITLDATVNPASVSFDNSAGNDYSLTGTGSISGSNTLTKSNTGNLTISTANTYSGGTAISAGKIIAAAVNALGTGPVTNNATLDLTAGAVAYTGLSNSMSGNGTVNVTLGTGATTTSLNGDYSSFTGTINIGSGASPGAGRVQMHGADNASSNIRILQHGTLYLSANVTKNATLTLYGGDTGESQGQLRLETGATWAGDVILAGNLTGSGDYTIGCNSGGAMISGDISEIGGSRALSKGGGSTITLSGSNSYTGLTTVLAGTLKLGSAGALGGSTIKTSGIEVNGTGILDLAGFSPTAVVPLALNSTASTADTGSLQNSSAGTTATFAGAVTLGATTVVVGGGNTAPGGHISLSGAITGNGNSLKKDGLGILSLANSGTVTLGALLVNRGTIEVGAGSSFSVTGINVGSGNSVGSNLTLNGGNVTSSGAALFGTATSGTASGTLQLNSGSTLTVPSLAKGGSAGASVVFNANFNGGTLKASAANSNFFAGANNARIQAGGLDVDDGGFDITVGQSLIHDSALDSPSVTADGGLTKTGSGTLTLSGTNTYTGATLISGGTLKLDAAGTINNTSEVSLGTTGTFDVSAKGAGYTVAKLTGSGNVMGGLSVSTQLAIGNSPGTTSFSGNLTLGSGSTYLYDLTGGVAPGLNSADLADVAGNLSINAGSILDLLQIGTYTTNNKFTLFAYDGVLSGTFRDTSLNVLDDGATFTDAGGIWVIDYNDSSAGANGGVSASNTYVTITAIPEPNLAALMGGFGVVALLRRRRI